MARYNKDRKIINSSDYYSFLRKKRGVKVINHYETPRMFHPGALQRSHLTSDNYIWKYGDRFYQLANTYYGDPRYWWVIAWYNGYPTEADIKPGVLISIPLNIEKVLDALGV
mgnify:CR=1 FL=1